MKYFKKFKNCVLVFINENNLSLNNVSFKSNSLNNDSFKSNKVVSKSKENKKEYLIKNYGIGAQILKELKIRKMTLLTKTPKNVVGLDGFGIKILNQEIIS